MFGEPAGELAQVEPRARHLVDDPEAGGGVLRGDRGAHAEIEFVVHDLQERADLLNPDRAAAKRDDLVEDALRIAQRTVGPAGDQLERGVVDVDLLLLRDRGDGGDDLGRGDPPELEPLAAREDGRGDLVHLGRGEHEDDVRRRLLQGLQQGVEGLLGEHVHFVDDVDLVLPLRGPVPDGLPQVADLVDAAVRRAVDLKDVDAPPLGDLRADFARIVGIGIVRIGTVDRAGEDPGGGGLADPPRSAEEVGVAHPAGGDGVAKRGGDMLLADDVPEHPGTPFPGGREVRGFGGGGLFFHGHGCGAI